MKAYILEYNGVQIGDTVWPSILDETAIKRDEVYEDELSASERGKVVIFNVEEFPEFEEVLFGSIVVRSYEGYNETYEDAKNAYNRFTNEQSLGFDEEDVS